MKVRAKSLSENLCQLSVEIIEVFLSGFSFGSGMQCDFFVCLF